MQQVGVEAVVAGLSSFLGDMGKVDKSIKGLIPGSNLLSRAFQGVGSVVEWLTGSVFRVLEYTLGSLLASAIQSVVGWLRDLVTGTMDSADEFAKLQLRLERLNFNSLTESGLEYNDAMKEAVRLTKEQVSWAVRLAAQTPFDASDVTNAYTLARGYEFTADEAKSLTEAVINFTSGMGLSATEMERVIVNFGQMRQQGKLNGQDLKDMARGAFVPVNRVLEITAEKLGMTTEEFNKLRSRGALSADAVNVFRESFEELVGVRFEGAAEKMGSVFSVAKENTEGLIRDLVGMNVVMPVLNMLGERMQAITEAIASSDERWNSLTSSMSRIGEVAAGIVSDLLGVGGSAESVADSLLSGLDKVATWLEEHRDDIVAWVQNAVKWIKDELIPKVIELRDWLFGTTEKTGFIEKIATFIEEKVIPAFENIKTWVSENEGTIKTFFTSLGEIAGGVFSGLGGTLPEDPLSGLLGGITAFMTFVNENKDTITQWVEGFIKAAVVFEVLGVVAGYVGKALVLVIALIGVLAPIISVLGKIITVVAGIFAVSFGQVLLIIAAVAAVIALLYLAWQTNFGGIRDLLTSAWERMQPAFQAIKDNIIELIPVFKDGFGQMGEAFKGLWDLIGPSLGGILAVIVGIVIGIVQGIAEGIGAFLKVMKYIISGVTTFISGVVNLFTGWWTLMTGLFSFNGEKIKEGWNTLWQGVGQILSGAFQLIAGLLTSNLAFLLGFIKGFVTGVFNFFKDLYNKLVGHSIVPEMMQAILNTFVTFFTQIIGKIAGFVSGVIEKFNDIRNRILSIDWLGIGTSIIDGIRNGITNAAASLASAAASAAQSALDAARRALGIRSPSTAFFEVGEQLMQGFANGITATADLAAKAMQGATAGAISIGAMAPARLASAMVPGTVANNTTNNFTLNMHSSAQKEPVIADFEMMRSLAT